MLHDEVSCMQSMIVAFNNDYKGLRRHNYRSALKMVFDPAQPQARTVETRLNSTYMQVRLAQF